MAKISFISGLSLLTSRDIDSGQDAGCAAGCGWIRPLVFALAAVLAGDLAAAKAADAVLQKSTNRTINGDITQITKDAVKVKSLSKTVEIPANDVSSIKWADEPAKLNVVRSDERGGRFKKALKGYEDVQQSIDSPVPGLKADLEYGIAHCAAQMALQTAGDDAEAITKLEAFQQGNPHSYHYYDCLNLLGRLYISKRDWERAESNYAELAKSSLPEYKMAAKIGSGNLLLARDDGETASAAAEFDAVINMNAISPGEKAKRLEAVSGKASCLIREQKYAEALALLDQIISDVTITDDAVLANAYIQQGKCHLAADEPKLAVLSFLHVDALFFKVQPAHAEALYNLSRLWPQVGKPLRGEKARTQLDSLYPDSRWAKQLNDN